MSCYLKIFILFFLSFVNFSLNAQKKILFAASGHTQEKFIKNYNLDKVIMFYQNEFVSNDGVNFDASKFEKFLLSKIPNKLSYGFAILDWEGVSLQTLSKGKSDNNFENVMNEFIKAISFAKKKRPNIRWSYYGLPSRIYWHIGDAWVKNSKDLVPLFKQQDFISPSLYVLYLKKESNINNDLNYIQKNVQLALQLGSQLNKPVYPFIYHRTRTPNKDYRDALVELDVWDFYIANLSKVKYNNKSINGVIWWNSERYSYINRLKSPALKREYSKVNNIEDYQYQTFELYFKTLDKYFLK